MKKIAPHIIIVLVLTTIVLTGFLTNSGSIGRFAGMSTALFLEPAILIAGIVAGFSKKYSKLIINCLLLSLLMIVYVYYNVSQWHTALGVSYTLSQQIYIYSIRVLDVFLLAHIVNIPVVLYFNKQH